MRADLIVLEHSEKSSFARIVQTQEQDLRVLAKETCSSQKMRSRSLLSASYEFGAYFRKNVVSSLTKMCQRGASSAGQLAEIRHNAREPIPQEAHGGTMTLPTSPKTTNTKKLSADANAELNAGLKVQPRKAL